MSIRPACFAAVAVLAAAISAIAGDSTGVSAAPAPIFTLTDPRGDDHGDGTLRYPTRNDLAPGDLDLLKLSASPEGDGTLFEATFARKIRIPGREPIDAGGTALSSIARFGFYTLNLDLYIDTDHVSGSGSVEMLPGRRAEADSASAWEKAIALTPRPYEALDELTRMRVSQRAEILRRARPRVDERDLDSLRAAIAAEIESTVFFPTRIRVLGSRIRFFVPGVFLGGPARGTWSYVVAVSGADIVQRVDIQAAIAVSADFSEGLMVLPIGPGSRQDRFGGGREHDDLEPPLVDIVVPPGTKQEAALSDYDLRTRRPARLRGVTPAGTTPATVPR